MLIPKGLTTKKPASLMILIYYVPNPLPSMYTYILQLENGCWYVGKTSDIVKRLKKHYSNTFGVAWLKVYKPVKTFLVVTGDYERDYTLNLMRLYGHSRVRGHAWCQVKRNKPPNELLIENLKLKY